MNKLIITIFGSTGDLTIRKLLPALSNVINTQKDFTSLSIVAVGRRPFASEDYLSFAEENGVNHQDIDILRPHLMYCKLDIVDGSTYVQLSDLHTALVRGFTTVRKIFYLAVGPDLFIPISENLTALNLITKGDENSIIAFEKPFGHTYEDAQLINKFLETNLTARQIYRVDHYLGKAMIQKLLGLRFSNEMIHGLWQKDHISEVKIVVTEEDGILNRGAYYDEVGVLNDMIQSHLLQMFALVIMDAPKSLRSHDVQQAKIAALKRVEYIPSASLLGQYKGYREEKGVDPNSPISTLAFLTFKVHNSTFKDVPFYLFTGKKLAKKEAYIEILFKTPPSAALFPNAQPNSLRIELAPFSRVTFGISSNEENNGDELQHLELEHCYDCEFPSAVKEAYEILFNEMMAGRKTLFPSWEEIDTAWQIITQIRAQKPRWITYDQGFSLDGGKQNDEV